MKSSLDKDDPATNYLCKREAEIGHSKEGEHVQDEERTTFVPKCPAREVICNNCQ